MEHRARAGGGPHSASFPAGVRVVDAAIHILAEEAHGIRNVYVHELAVDKREERLAAVGLGDRHIGPEPERVVPIDPEVIRVLGAAGVGDSFELRPRKLIQGPTFRTVLAGRRGWSIERALALAPIEARQMSTRERRPHHAAEIEVDPPRPVSNIRRQVDFGQGRLRGIGTGHQPEDVPGLIEPREADVHRLAPD